MKSMKLPIWLRFTLLAGVVILTAGASLFAYRYYTHPVTLTVAVGSIDGEAAKAMSAIASELVSTNKPVRLKVIDSGTALEAANAFSAGKVDLAVVRGDVGDLSQAQAVVVVSHVVVLIVAPPGSSIDSMDGLKGHKIGVVGGVANSKIVDVLTKEYDLVPANFKNIALTDVKQFSQNRSALYSSRSHWPKNISPSFADFFSWTTKRSRYSSQSTPPRQSQRRNALMKVSTFRRARCGDRHRFRTMTSRP